MNILFISLLDFNNIEDRNIYTDLLRFFLKKGHYICAISPIECRNNLNTSIIKKENLLIIKPIIGKTQKTNMIEKGISILMLETQLKNSIKKYASHVKFDLILYTTPPITFYKAVNYIKCRDNAKTYLLLKDIFPQNAVDLGLIRKEGLKGFIYKYFRNKEKKLYKISDYIGCLSPANIDFLFNNNEIDKLVEVCPNSIEPIEIAFRCKENLKKKFNIPNNCITFIYGGNLGRPQDINFIIKCLQKNINLDDRYFIICGTGMDYYKLDNFFNKVKPQNMRLINGLPKKDYDELVAACDIGLIFLDYRFTIPNFPSRLLTYMENSMPVFACTDVSTDIGKIIVKGEFGWWCESNDDNKFYNIINKICNDRSKLGQMGINSRNYLDKFYAVEHSYQIIIKHFTNSIENIN